MATTKIRSSSITDGQVSNADLSATVAVTGGQIADDAITLAKMAGLARGKIIVGDASGDPSALTVGAANQVLKSDGTDVSWGTDVGGKILQVVTTTKTDVTTSTTSTSFVDLTGMTVSITPSAATSKVLIMVAANIGGGNLYRNQLRLMRDSTPIFIGDQLGSNRARSTWFIAMTDAQTTYNAAGTYLDSPNTTSATTYKLQWAMEAGITMYLNRPYDNGTDIFKYGTSCSTITVMEVAA